MNISLPWLPLSCSFLALILSSASAPAAQDWPQWRGPNRDGHAPADAPVPTTLPRELKPMWKISVGGGFSSPILLGNKLVYLDENGTREVAHMLDAATGKELWHVDYADRAQDEWGAGPRATPTIDGDRIYVQSMNGEFRCLRFADGTTLWQTSFEKDFGVQFLGMKAGPGNGVSVRRGNNGSGVIAGDRVVLPVGGTNGASLVCFDKIAGKVFWKSGQDEAAYSSFVSATLAGVKQVVALTADSLLGADPENGKILWRLPVRSYAKRHVASPVIFGDCVIINTLSIGLCSYKITRENSSFKVAEAWAVGGQKINLASPVVVDGHIYILGANKDYACFDAQTGALKWSQPGFGASRKDYAATIAIGKNLLVLTEAGDLVLLQANPQKYTELGRLQVCANTWSHPAYADGKLYVRDGRTLQCIDLLAKVN